MKVTFLGTGSATPSRSRNVTSIALQLPEQGTLWLFDCGEGTQHQILRSPLRLSQLERIFITHLHGDHLYGLPGLLASRSLQNGGISPVTIYGPAGIEEYVRVSLSASHSRPSYPIEVRTIQEGILYEDSRFTVQAAPMRHRLEAYGFAIQEKPLPGQFNVAMARSLGIPEGPLYGLLKAGKDITLTDGRVIHGRDLLGAPRPGRRFVSCGDTTYTQTAVELAKDADFLIHEATYLHSELQQAIRGQHSTAVMAANVAKQAGAHKLALTHFSARYETSAQLNALLEEAREIFPNTILAYDFLTVEIEKRIAPDPVSISPNFRTDQLNTNSDI